MKLTSDQTYWLARNGMHSDYPSLQTDVACQCVVVGAGVTGAMLSDRLARDGFDVIVVDQRDVCSGSTSASTALLLYDLDIPLIKLARLIGWHGARRAYQQSHASIDAMEELADGLEDDVDFQRNTSVYLALDDPSDQDIRAEVEARRSCGLLVDYHCQQELRETFGLLGSGALSTRQAASCDPIRLARALLKRAERNGARVFDDTPITKFEFHRNKVKLTTERGTTVTADHGIIATGYEATVLLREPIVSLSSTYALISEPIVDLGSWDRRWMLWEARDPYLYMRVTTDNRLLLGGEDDAYVDASTRDARIPSKMQTLHAKLRAILPGLEWQPAAGWAGIFGQTKDGLPYIGPTPEMAGYQFALGFGGNGMTFSQIACEQIVRTLRGEANPDAHLFRFGR